MRFYAFTADGHTLAVIVDTPFDARTSIADDGASTMRSAIEFEPSLGKLGTPRRVRFVATAEPGYVAAAGAFGGTVIRQLGIEEAEAFVVLGGEHHVLLAGPFGEFGPLPRNSGLRREALGQLLIFGDGDGLLLQHPFAAFQHAVEAPMDEHPELRVVPPAQALRARAVARLRLRRRLRLRGDRGARANH